MVIKPYADKIIVRRKMESEYLIIPDSKLAPVEGEVVAFGPDTSFVKGGDKIIFGKYSAHKISDGEDLWVILESDIIYKKENDDIDSSQEEN